jgi:hypothetical protein
MDDTECDCNDTCESYFTCELHDLNSGVIPRYGSIIRFDAARCDPWYGICVSRDTKIKIIYPQIKIHNGNISLGLDMQSNQYTAFTNECNGKCNNRYLNNLLCNECEALKTFREADDSYKYTIFDYEPDGLIYPVIQKKLDNLYAIL